MIKRAFTLTELVVVMLIIGFLSTLAYRISISQNISQQYSFGVECANYLNKDIQLYIDKARKSQQVLSGSVKILPDYYIINFNTGDVSLQYKLGSATGVYQDIIADADTFTHFKCMSNRYNIIFTGFENNTYLNIEITRGFQANRYNELSSFKITEPSGTTTGTVFLQACIGNECIDVSKFDITMARQEIKKEICWSYDDAKKTKCRTWR